MPARPRPLVVSLLVALLVAMGLPAPAADVSLPPVEKTLPAQARYDLELVLERIQSKVRRGRKTEADLGPELLALDTLIARYSGTDAEVAAEFLVTKALLYAQVLRLTAQARALFAQVKADFPGTIAALKVDELSARWTP